MFQRMRASWKSRTEHERLYIVKLLMFFAFFLASAIFHQLFRNYVYNFDYSYNEKFLVFLIFPIFIGLTALSWEKIKTLPLSRNMSFKSKLLFVPALLLLMFPLGRVIGAHRILLDLALFAVLYPACLLAFVALFGVRFFKAFIPELTLITSLYLYYQATLFALNIFWRPVSFTIVKVMSYVLPLFAPGVRVDPSTYNVAFNALSVNIGPKCAGFYSLITFTLLFTGALLLVQRYRRVRYARAFAIWLAASALLFIFNIARLIIIVLVGGYWSPVIALSFFHEYLSAIILISLFSVFMYKVLPRLVWEAHVRSSE